MVLRGIRALRYSMQSSPSPSWCLWCCLPASWLWRYSLKPFGLTFGAAPHWGPCWTRTVTTLLNRVEVDPADPAFAKPTKPIGLVYTQDQATRIAAEKHWAIAPDGDSFRRMVASPQPIQLPGLDPIRWLLECGALVIAAGAGGIPVVRSTDAHSLQGVEAVIDKALCSGLLARELKADCLIIATDVSAVFNNWGLPGLQTLGDVTPEILEKLDFPAGSMVPKVRAAVAFVRATGKRAVIGSLDQIQDMLSGIAGTQVGANVAAKTL